jgi:hypothetical protein
MPVKRRKHGGGERNGRFVKGGEPGPGRPARGHDKFSREIKTALLDAVEYVGEEKAAEFLATNGKPDWCGLRETIHKSLAQCSRA